MDKLTATVSITDTELFNRLAKLVTDLGRDERIPLEVRDEIGREVYDMVQCN